MSAVLEASRWIEQLGLVRHKEGGFYRQSYKSAGSIPKISLPNCFDSERSFSTAIYFLLEADDFSAFHRINQDELWHFYCGNPVTIHTINEAGEYRAIKLGCDLNLNEFPQAIVKAQTYFAASVDSMDGYALVGCTVAPGFEYEDFELPDRQQLITRFPAHRELIEKFSR